MNDLFSAIDRYQPLAAKMRPENLQQYMGQSHLLGEGKPLRQAITQDRVYSMILWGPPGVGKTSLANVIANETESNFISLSAIMSGVKDIRAAVEKAKLAQTNGSKTILFVDEVHRFNKSQQDAFLPYIEDGTFIFIGATTENPAFELNNALLSRCRVHVLQKLSDDELRALIQKALEDETKGLGLNKLKFTEEALIVICALSDGDSRKAYNLLELISDDAQSYDGEIDKDRLTHLLGDRVRSFDKGGDVFYDQVSALQKSVRGSDPDAALYWFCRMIDGGCDPLYIARRLVRIASEDIGNADPRALQLSLNAWDTYARLGSPEGEGALAQCILYLASAAKSNAAYKAYNTAMAHIRSNRDLSVPVHLRNAPTKLSQSMGHGIDYVYEHDRPDAFAPEQSFWPDDQNSLAFYQPVDRGLEIKIKQKLDVLREQRIKAKKKSQKREVT